jgi:hypothetical protein
MVDYIARRVIPPDKYLHIYDYSIALLSASQTVKVRRRHVQRVHVCVQKFLLCLTVKTSILLHGCPTLMYTCTVVHWKTQRAQHDDGATLLFRTLVKPTRLTKVKEMYVSAKYARTPMFFRSCAYECQRMVSREMQQRTQRSTRDYFARVQVHSSLPVHRERSLMALRPHFDYMLNIVK